MSRLTLFNSPLLLGFDHFERVLTVLTDQELGRTVDVEAGGQRRLSPPTRLSFIVRIPEKLSGVQRKSQDSCGV